LTPTKISELSRRRLLATMIAVGASVGLPGTALAMTQAEARRLIDSVMSEVQGIINSGRSEARMLTDFEAFFARRGDVPAIARSVLGPPARTVSAAQLAAFTQAFQGYMARKYGRQFRRFIGARADVRDARQVQRYWEVITTMTLQGRSPFEVRWHVSDRGGSAQFFNLIIEGVNLLAAERQEIAAMLQRRGGNVDRMIQDLRAAG
jgi:phospholipid transport system substrate-binding protein